ncbi:MAG: zf-HC2 domain-containing protein [Acidobacteriota bacterium]
MTSQTQIIGFDCPTDEIAAYIDGEIDPVREFELEAHLDRCEVCSHELNQQKQFLIGLNSSLKHEGDLELPANFTKLIVANAESTVSGLRRPRERFNALFICAGLFFFALFALGAEAGKELAGVSTIVDQLGAIAGFFGHLVYSAFVGVAVILRSLAGQFRSDLVLTVFFTGILALFLLAVSHRVIRELRV